MKKQIFMLLVLIIGIFFVSSTYAFEVIEKVAPVPSSMQSYPMTCLPGGSMQLTYVTEGQAKLKLSFSKASGASLLRGGQCSWMDRPIGADEPSKMEMLVSSPQVKGFVMNSSNSSVSLWNAEEPLLYFIRAFGNKQRFYVHCRREGSVFRITQTGR